MSRDEKNRIEYVVMCVFLFARRFDLHVKAALTYLLSFGGIAFLEENYEIEHTLPIDDTMESLQIVCARNGGRLA